MRSILSNNAALTDTVPLLQPTKPCKEVPRKIAEAAFVEYDYSIGGQTFERLHERGGFGVIELMGLLYDRIERLEQNARDNTVL